MTNNIRGIFPIEICGGVRDAKATIGVAIKLEEEILKMPITQKLSGILFADQLPANEREFVSYTEVIKTLQAALEANGDTRFSFDEIGESLVENGFDKYAAWFIEFLTYYVTKVEDKSSNKTDDSKKN